MKAVKQRHDMLNVFEHKRAMDEEHLAIAKERLDIEKMKANGSGGADDDLIDDWVASVMEADDGSS